MNEFVSFRDLIISKVGSLAAIHLGKRGHKVDLFEYREGE